MNKSASEIINDLEDRIARLENRTAGSDKATVRRVRKKAQNVIKAVTELREELELTEEFKNPFNDPHLAGLKKGFVKLHTEAFKNIAKILGTYFP